MKYFAATVLLLAPMLVFGAGFAKQSLFLSKSPVTEGDTVRIYAVLSNETSTKFTGSIVFRDGQNKLGAPAVSIDAGGAQTASVAWQPAAGSHAITATLEGTDGATVEQQSETFEIKEKPLPPPPASHQASQGAANQPAAVESSQNIQNQIGSFSPQVEGAVSPVFNVIDSARDAIAGALDKQLAATKPKLTTLPMPGTAADGSTKTPSNFEWLWSIVYTIYFYILTILRFIVGSAAVFYPVIAILFLLFMYKMFRRFRRT